MNAIQRKLVILNRLKEEGVVDIKSLAELFDVSTMTIRRDLLKLSEEGLVSMEHGGAVINDTSLFEYSIPFKQESNLYEKTSIAKKALNYIKNGSTIYLDAGTTVAEIAKLLTDNINLTVLTHSLLVANHLSKNKGINLIMMPGEYREKSMAFMGPLTDNYISNFNIDTLFLGVEGIDINHVSVPDIMDGLTKKKLVENSNQVICIADSMKYDKSFFYKICESSQIDVFITDINLSEQKKAIYEQNNINLIIVDE